MRSAINEEVFHGRWRWNGLDGTSLSSMCTCLLGGLLISEGLLLLLPPGEAKIVPSAGSDLVINTLPGKLRPFSSLYIIVHRYICIYNKSLNQITWYQIWRVVNWSEKIATYFHWFVYYCILLSFRPITTLYFEISTIQIQNIVHCYSVVIMVYEENNWKYNALWKGVLVFLVPHRPQEGEMSGLYV